MVYQGDGLTHEQIKADFDPQLDAAGLRECEAGAQRMIDQLVSINASIGKCLQETNGTVSWETIACEVADGANRIQPSCKTATATYVMSTYRYRATYTPTKLQPTMNDANKKQCFDWSKHFFLFYKGAKLFWPKSQLLNLHIDKKWFYCLVIRSKNKWVPYLGVTPNHHNAHHKNSADKVLCIALVGSLPHDNDQKNGGESVLIDIS
jgi:hypothetical protein